MIEQITVKFVGGSIGPFKDRVAAAHYLSQLNIEGGGMIPIIAPPQMSDLLVMAIALVQKTGEPTTNELLAALAEAGENSVSWNAAEQAIQEALQLQQLVKPDESKMSNELLAEKLYKQCYGRPILAIKELRSRRPMGLLEAKNLIWPHHANAR